MNLLHIAIAVKKKVHVIAGNRNQPIREAGMTAKEGIHTDTIAPLTLVTKVKTNPRHRIISFARHIVHVLDTQHIIHFHTSFLLH
jgi:hypothetical protein